jgi:hypothetical protein
LVNRRTLDPSTQAKFQTRTKIKTKYLFIATGTGNPEENRAKARFLFRLIKVCKQRIRSFPSACTKKAKSHGMMHPSARLAPRPAVSHPQYRYRCVSPALDRVIKTKNKASANHTHAARPAPMSASQPPLRQEPPRLHALISRKAGQSDAHPHPHRKNAQET